MGSGCPCVRRWRRRNGIPCHLHRLNREQVYRYPLHHLKRGRSYRCLLHRHNQERSHRCPLHRLKRGRLYRCLLHRLNREQAYRCPLHRHNQEHSHRCHLHRLNLKRKWGHSEFPRERRSEALVILFLPPFRPINHAAWKKSNVSVSSLW